MVTINDVADANALYRSFHKSMKGVGWKASVQRYEMNMLRNINSAQKDLLAGVSPCRGFTEFDMHERGKTRHVKSVHIKERVVQRSNCDNALVPTYSKGLIYDNAASQKGKGLHHAVDRLDCHLHRYYRRQGNNEGYILLIDFKGYYNNILHSKVYERLDKHVKDPDLRRLSRQLIEPFDDGNGKSLGIGSQISQVVAIDYPTELDHMIKHDLKIKEYARYMDDSYLIHPSKEYLQECLTRITQKCDELGIIINTKKTQIVKLSHGFTYLKVRWIITPTGAVIKRPCKASVTRERRKLKKFRRMLDEGTITMDTIDQQYKSWKGDKTGCRHGDRVIKYNCYYTIQRMDKLFNELFKEYLKEDESHEKT